MVCNQKISILYAIKHNISLKINDIVIFLSIICVYSRKLHTIIDNKLNNSIIGDTGFKQNQFFI